MLYRRASGGTSTASSTGRESCGESCSFTPFVFVFVWLHEILGNRWGWQVRNGICAYIEMNINGLKVDFDFPSFSHLVEFRNVV